MLLNAKVTISHFAEHPQSATNGELPIILAWNPDRIGHVINVPSDVKEEIIKQKTGLELCLSCNVHAKMITGTYGDHHFGWWRDTGCPIALSVSLIVVLILMQWMEMRLVLISIDGRCRCLRKQPFK